MAETDGLLFCDICNKSIPKNMDFTRTEGKLICAECRAKISGGLPPTQMIASKTDVQTIEKTSKKWKGTQLFGALCCMVGVLFMFAPLGLAWDTRVLGLFISVAGLAIIVVAKTFAWWHHG